MKQHFSAFLLVALLLALTGCDCNHDWTPADCVNPQVCTKCEEVGDPALGHDWVDATCTAPLTCSRCAATQGETLAHIYDDWTFGTELMTHTCTVCTYEEAAEIDQELYLESLLDGYWDLWSIDHNPSNEEITLNSFLNGTLSDDALLDGINTDSFHCGGSYLLEGGNRSSYFVFGEDRNCQITIGGLMNGIYSGKGFWELVNYVNSGDKAVYQIIIHTTEPQVEAIAIALCFDPNYMNRICFITSNSVMWFYQEQPEILDQICTNWVINPESFTDQSYCFQLRPDRTATCYVEGALEGTWSIGAHPENRDMVSFNISYARNGKDEVFAGDIEFRGSEITVPTLWLQNNYNAPTGRYNYIEFLEASDQELKIAQNTTDLLAGTWTSYAFGFPNPEFADSLTTDYSITIGKNNKVTLYLPDGRTYSGGWSAQHRSEHLFRYYLYLEDKRINGALSIQGEDIYLALTSDGVLDSDALYFRQMSEHERAGANLPVGSWTSTSQFDISTKQQELTNAYTITFDEDGTFTGLLGQEVSGTWNYFSYYEHEVQGYESEADDSPETFVIDDWCYRLTFDGESEHRDLHIEEYRNSDGPYFTMTFKDSAGNTIKCNFSKD